LSRGSSALTDLNTGIRVARLRAIFAVPKRLEAALFARNVPGPLAVVEWFSAPAKRLNHVNGMFPVARSFGSDGKQQYGIIELADVRRGCQLIPKFGRSNVAHNLTPHSVLDGYDEFYLNNRADKDSYQSIYWEVSDDEDEDD